MYVISITQQVPGTYVIGTAVIFRCLINTLFNPAMIIKHKILFKLTKSAKKSGLAGNKQFSSQRTFCIKKRPVASFLRNHPKKIQRSYWSEILCRGGKGGGVGTCILTWTTDLYIYHALTRIFTSPSWGSGIAFLVTLSLFRPPKPARMTARISLASPVDSTFSVSFPTCLSIMYCVSSVKAAASFAMS